MTSPVKNVHMLILLENDIPKAIEFYKKLGLKLQFHLENQWAEFLLGGVKIGLCPYKEELPERRTGIVFEVDDINALYNELKDTGVFVGEPVEKVHGIMLGIKDPGGNIIDLYQPTPEKVQEMVEKIKKEDKEKEACCGGTSDDCKCKAAGKECCNTKTDKQSKS